MTCVNEDPVAELMAAKGEKISGRGCATATPDIWRMVAKEFGRPRCKICADRIEDGNGDPDELALARVHEEPVACNKCRDAVCEWCGEPATMMVAAVTEPMGTDCKWAYVCSDNCGQIVHDHCSVNGRP